MSPRRRTLLAAAGALGVAGLILITAVLPAEYGFDPLGTGEALGLTGMAAAGVRPVNEQPERWLSDRRRFEIGPFESLELKYRLEQDATLLYRWTATSEVVFDLHAEPDGAAPGYAESFAAGRGNEGSGSYRAPFPGIHGWFWQNRQQEAVIVELEVAGHPDWVVEFRDGFERRYNFHQSGP